MFQVTFRMRCDFLLRCGFGCGWQVGGSGRFVDGILETPDTSSVRRHWIRRLTSARSDWTALGSHLAALDSGTQLSPAPLWPLSKDHVLSKHISIPRNYWRRTLKHRLHLDQRDKFPQQSPSAVTKDAVNNSVKCFVIRRTGPSFQVYLLLSETKHVGGSCYNEFTRELDYACDMIVALNWINGIRYQCGILNGIGSAMFHDSDAVY